jgi:YggT family protein
VSLVLVRDWIASALGIYEICIFVYALMSWFTGLGGAAVQIYNVLATVCEPFVGMVRRVLPQQLTGGGGFDASPFVAMLVLILAQRIVRGF